MASRVWSGFLLVAAILALVAGCGGGGGSSGGSGGLMPTPGTTPSFTTLSGTLVDDPSGVPLAGERVAIEPWIAGATPLPSPQTTTAADGSFTLGGVANGHYLLVIGSDSVNPLDGRPTIHDNITANGGAQTLHAPVLPPIPLVTPPAAARLSQRNSCDTMFRQLSPKHSTARSPPLGTPPAAETSGAYRRTTLNANETPCLAAFNAERASHSLASVVPDEWLVENSRAIAEEHVAWNGIGPPPTPEPSNPYGSVTTGNESVNGGASCSAALIAPAYDGSNPFATTSDTLWFGGTWYSYDSGSEAFGDAEFPRDPRGYADPNVPNWP